MPTYIAQITQAEWESATAVNPLVLKAYDYPGADAGLKIAAAIAALPAGIGGLVDATKFGNPQNCTGFTIPPGVTVQLSPVLYTMQAAGPSIVINEGGRLIGAGSNNPGATKIKASTNFNKPLIVCIAKSGATGYWHGGLVQDLWLDGTKASQTAGNALEVYSCAERSVIQRLNISDAKQAGLFISGSQSGTGSMHNITTNTCGTYGVQLDQFRSAITLICVGGDFNPVTFGITNPITGGGSILLIDPKSEAAGTGDTTATPVIRITGGSAKVTLTIVGGNSLCPPGINKTLVELAADVGAHHTVQILGHFGGNTIPTLINDLKDGHTVTCPGTTYHGMLAYDGGQASPLWTPFPGTYTLT